MQDTSKLFIDFTKCPKGTKLVNYFDELSAYSEFTKCGDEKYIKIAILSGDIESPFISIRDRKTMITAIFDYLEINTTRNKKLLNDIIEFKDLIYANAWLKYLFIQNEVEFTDWQLANRDYEYFLSRSTETQGKDETDKAYLIKRKDIRKTIADLGAEKKKLEARLFPDSKAAREAALLEGKNKIRLYAEMYAKEGTFL